jgi:hypothetical protein
MKHNSLNFYIWILINLGGLFYFTACAEHHNQILNEKQTSEHLANFTHAAIEVIPNHTMDENLSDIVQSMMFKRLHNSKLFNSVSYFKDAAPNADVIIRAEVLDTKTDLQKNTWFKNDFGTDVTAIIRYTLIAKKSNKTLGQIQIASDNAMPSAGPGFQDTKKGYTFGRSCDQLVRYIERNQ